jgi:hypothetical protein
VAEDSSPQEVSAGACIINDRPRGGGWRERAHRSTDPPILHDRNVPDGRVGRGGNLFLVPGAPDIYRCKKCGCLFTEDP